MFLITFSALVRYEGIKTIRMYGWTRTDGAAWTISRLHNKVMVPLATARAPILRCQHTDFALTQARNTTGADLMGRVRRAASAVEDREVRPRVLQCGCASFFLAPRVLFSCAYICSTRVSFANVHSLQGTPAGVVIRPTGDICATGCNDVDSWQVR